MTEPWVPYIPGSPLRALYQSVVQVERLVATLENGAASVAWAPIEDVLDMLGIPGQMACRLDLMFIRRGAEVPMPLVAGRAPDRIGTLYCDLAAGPTGAPLILSGDRIVAISGPITGTFEIRTVPDVAQGISTGHHIECQIVEVSQALQPGGLMPFPGAQP